MPLLLQGGVLLRYHTVYGSGFGYRSEFKHLGVGCSFGGLLASCDAHAKRREYRRHLGIQDRTNNLQRSGFMKSRVSSSLLKLMRSLQGYGPCLFPACSIHALMKGLFMAWWCTLVHIFTYLEEQPAHLVPQGLDQTFWGMSPTCKILNPN